MRLPSVLILINELSHVLLLCSLIPSGAVGQLLAAGRWFSLASQGFPATTKAACHDITLNVESGIKTPFHPSAILNDFIIKLSFHLGNKVCEMRNGEEKFML